MVPYEHWHLEQLELRPEQAGEKPAIITHSALTFLLDGRPVAIFGGYALFPGVFQAWGLVSEEVRKIAIRFFRSIFSVLTRHQEKYRRVQITIRVGCSDLWKWAKTLGFTCEGILKSYGIDGADYWMFARVR